MPQDIYSMKLPNEDNDIFLRQWKFRLNLFHTFSNMNVLSWMHFFLQDTLYSFIVALRITLMFHCTFYLIQNKEKVTKCFSMGLD